MVLEATGDMQYVLPLMLTVMTARWVGNIFTEGIYDMHIHTRRLNYLDEDEPVSRATQMHDLTISDVMTPRPYYMLPFMRVGEYYDILAKAKHNCYPVGELLIFILRILPCLCLSLFFLTDSAIFILSYPRFLPCFCS
jgi:chloride channel 7